MTDPRAGYFAWRTGVARRDSFPDIDWAVEQLLRECWGAAFDLGRKRGVLDSANFRAAADAYRDYVAILTRWDEERLILEQVDQLEASVS